MTHIMGSIYIWGWGWGWGGGGGATGGGGGWWATMHCPPHNWDYEMTNQSNQSNPVLLKEPVRIPRTRRAGGAAMLWGALPLGGVGSCRLFSTDDLQDTLSQVPASDKPHSFKSCFTHSSQVFFGHPGPFLPGTGLDLPLCISPLERMICLNHLSRRSEPEWQGRISIAWHADHPLMGHPTAWPHKSSGS